MRQIHAIATLAGLLLFTQCDKSGEIEPVVDPAFIVSGIVIDSASLAPVTDALVGFRNPMVEDTIVFLGDSVLTYVPGGFLDVVSTRDDGTFRFWLFLQYRDTLRYQLMFASKSGYRLWRYDHDQVSVGWLNADTDTLTIRMRKK